VIFAMMQPWSTACAVASASHFSCVVFCPLSVLVFFSPLEKYTHPTNLTQCNILFFQFIDLAGKKRF